MVICFVQNVKFSVIVNNVKARKTVEPLFYKQIIMWEPLWSSKFYVPKAVYLKNQSEALERLMSPSEGVTLRQLNVSIGTPPSPTPAGWNGIPQFPQPPWETSPPSTPSTS